MNAAGFGFKSGFQTFVIPTLILEIIWFAAGAAKAYLGGLLLFYTALVGLGFGLVFGGLMALASHNIPNIKINTVQWGNEYHRQLKYITRKTQKYFVSRFPKKVRLI
jgi:predicted phage tail protein